MDDFNKLHKKFTSESDSIIYLEDLVEKIAVYPLEIQNEILKKIYLLSKKVSMKYLAENKEQETFLAKRDNKQAKRKKIISKKKLSNSQKTYINNEIEEYQKITKKLLNENLSEFAKSLENCELNDLNYINLGFVKERNTYEDFAAVSFAKKDEATMKEAKKVVSSIKEKINSIEALREKQEEKEEEKEEEIKLNQLIFLETTSGRSYFLQDIFNDQEQYKSYFKLLRSLQIGKPLNKKRLTGDGILKGLMEVKDLDGQTRIFYEKLAPNTYIIINAIIKKVGGVNKGYLEQLENRYKYYLKMKLSILEKLSNEEYISKQNLFLKEIMDVLDPSSDIKIKLKNKTL